jgi:hypothetical protein
MVHAITVPRESRLVDVCIQIENEKTQLFYNLMKRFPEPAQAGVFWRRLCEEEYARTAALTFIKGGLELEMSDRETVNSEEDQLYRFLRLLERYNRKVRFGRVTLNVAFKMAVKLKTSEVDGLYEQILNSTDPMMSAIAARFLRSIPLSWLDFAKTIESCSTDENLLRKVRQLAGKGQERLC